MERIFDAWRSEAAKPQRHQTVGGGIRKPVECGGVNFCQKHNLTLGTL
jgi:hypothetical protein